MTKRQITVIEPNGERFHYWEALGKPGVFVAEHRDDGSLVVTRHNYRAAIERAGRVIKPEIDEETVEAIHPPGSQVE